VKNVLKYFAFGCFWVDLRFHDQSLIVHITLACVNKKVGLRFKIREHIHIAPLV
jgi:hypothetical protein